MRYSNPLPNRVLSAALALILCITMVVPAFASDADTGSDEQSGNYLDSINVESSQEDESDDIDKDDNTGTGGENDETPAPSPEPVEPGEEDEDGTEPTDEDKNGETPAEPGNAGASGSVDGVEPEEEEESLLDAAMAGEPNLTFELPQNRRVPGGTPYNPLVGVRVFDENGTDVTSAAEVDLRVEDPDGFDDSDPQPGIYTLVLAATHPSYNPEEPDDDLIFTEDYEITVFDFGNTSVTLLARTDINIGSYSYLRVTANPQFAENTGRYVVVHAPEDFGLTFDISKMAAVDAIEEMRTFHEGRSLLLKIKDDEPGNFAMEFPVKQENTAAISEKLTADMEFPFTAELYANLDDAPDESETPQRDFICNIPIANYDNSTLILTQSIKNSVLSDDISGHDSAVVRDSTTLLDDLKLTIQKELGALGMAPSHGLELIVPLHQGLTPLPGDGYTVDSIEIGGVDYPAFIVKVTQTAMLNSLLDPTEESSRYSFAFSPNFNLAGLQNGTYEAPQGITLRIYQYDGYYDHVLFDSDGIECTYTLKRESDRDAKLYYEYTPPMVMMGATNQGLTFRPRYDQYEEPVHNNLKVAINMQSQYFTPKSIQLANDRGNATIRYYTHDPNAGNPDPNNPPGLRESVYVQAGKSLVFDIPSGERVWRVEVIADQLDTSLSDRFSHFTIYGDFWGTQSPYGFFYSMSSDRKWASDAPYDPGRSNFTLKLVDNTFAWKEATQLFDEVMGWGGELINRNAYYMQDRPEGEQPISYFHYTYNRLIGEHTFDLNIPEDGNEGFLHSLTSILVEPGNTAAASNSYLTQYRIEYRTNKNASTRVIEVSGDGETKNSLADFGLDDDEHLTSLNINYTTAMWTNYDVDGSNAAKTLFQFRGDLNKYESIHQAPLPIQSDDRLHFTYTLKHETAGTHSETQGYAGMFYDSKTPHWVSGDNLQIDLDPQKLVLTRAAVLATEKSVQAGGDVIVTLDRFLTSHSEEDATRLYGDRLTLQNVTTYIPIASEFTYVDGTLDFKVNNPFLYRSGDIAIRSVSFQPAVGQEPGWIAVNWSVLTTGGYTYSLYRDDPSITFTVRSSPMASGVIDILPEPVYNHVEAAISTNQKYDINIAGGDGSGSHSFNGTNQPYNKLTQGTNDSGVWVLAAATYEVALYGGVEGGYFHNTNIPPYYNHDKLQAVVQMSYDSIVKGGTEDATVYVEIPRVGGAHKGLRLSGRVNSDDLPNGSKVYYTTEENPTFGVIESGNWDDPDDDFDEYLGDPSKVTAVKIVGMNLNDVFRYVYIPLENADNKEYVGDQTITLTSLVHYHNNSAANKADSIKFTLTDYKISGYFFEDRDGSGNLQLGSTIGGFLNTLRDGSTSYYPTVTATAADGYTARIPAYGTYNLTVFAPGYKSIAPRGDSPFTVDGEYTLTMNQSDGYSKVIHAGFEPDTSDSVLVYFNAKGGTPEPPMQRVQRGGTVSKPSDPEKDNVEFLDWYLGDEDGNVTTPLTAWNFNTVIVQEHIDQQVIYLIARYKDSAPTEIAVEDIHFGLRKIPMQQTIFQRDRPRDELKVSVSNPPSGSWDLTVKLTEPFTHQDNSAYIIDENALIYYKQDEPDPQNKEYLSAGVQLYSGDERSLELSWTEDFGILAEIGPQHGIHEGEYVAVLTWTIEQTSTSGGGNG